MLGPKAKHRFGRRSHSGGEELDPRAKNVREQNLETSGKCLSKWLGEAKTEKVCGLKSNTISKTPSSKNDAGI